MFELQLGQMTFSLIEIALSIASILSIAIAAISIYLSHKKIEKHKNNNNINNVDINLKTNKEDFDSLVEDVKNSFHLKEANELLESLQDYNEEIKDHNPDRTSICKIANIILANAENEDRFLSYFDQVFPQEIIAFYEEEIEECFGYYRFHRESINEKIRLLKLTKDRSDYNKIKNILEDLDNHIIDYDLLHLEISNIFEDILDNREAQLTKYFFIFDPYIKSIKSLRDIDYSDDAPQGDFADLSEMLHELRQENSNSRQKKQKTA